MNDEKEMVTMKFSGELLAQAIDVGFGTKADFIRAMNDVEGCEKLSRQSVDDWISEKREPMTNTVAAMARVTSRQMEEFFVEGV